MTGVWTSSQSLVNWDHLKNWQTCKETSILSVGLHPQSSHHHKPYLNVYPNMFAAERTNLPSGSVPTYPTAGYFQWQQTGVPGHPRKTGNFPGFPRVQKRPREQVCPSLAVEYGLTWFYNPLLRSAGTTYCQFPMNMNRIFHQPWTLSKGLDDWILLVKTRLRRLTMS